MVGLVNSFWGESNLFIGGISATITTPAILATYFDFLEADVSSFTIVGSDIEAKIIDSNYELITNKFNGDTNVTYLTETSGYLTVLNAGAFQDATSFVSVNCIGVTNIGIQTFFGCTALVPGDILLPELILAPTSSFRDLKTSTGTTLTLENLVTIAANTVFAGNDCDYSLPEVLTVGTTAFWNNSGDISMPKVTSLGLTVGDDSVFLTVSSSVEATVPVALQTIDSGSPDGDLVYLVSTRGGTVVYV